MVRAFAFRVLFLVGLVTVSLALKCGEGPLDDGLGPTARGINGTWLGTIEDLTIRLTLAENSGAATGTGTITRAGEPTPVSISGTAGSGAFSITIADPGHEPFTFAGSVQVVGTNTVMKGTVTGSGFQNDALTLTRQ